MKKVVTLSINSNNVVRVEGVKDATTGAYANDASVVFTMYDLETETPLSGVNWPIIMSYKNNSSGVYIGSTPPSMQMSKGQKILVVVTASLANGASTESYVTATAVNRKGNTDVCC